MPLAPETRLREGDVVAVLATVTYAPKGRDERYVHLRVADYHSPLILQPRDIDSVVRRSFKVGERVRVHPDAHRLRGGDGVIRAIDGESAWVKFDGNAMPQTVGLSALSLLEVDPPSADEAEPLPPPVEPPVTADHHPV